MADFKDDRSSGEKGLIFNIQRYSIHDGPGIRTTVFFKGCPLHCKWCSNPESISKDPEIMFRSARCDGCGRCVKACEQGLLKLNGNKVTIERDKCNRCFKCIEACYAEALEVTGRYYSLEEVVDEALRDEPFYRNSGGGVTLSGGEPLFQPDFAINVLKRCKEKGIHTALDTSGQVRWEVFKEALPHVDLVMFDIKHVESAQHREGTGVGNELILENLSRLSENGRARVWIRMPVIPCFNDGPEHISKLAELMKGMRIEKVSLLAYHEWGKPKYEALEREYTMEGTVPPASGKIEQLAGILRKAGFEVTADY